MALKPTIFKQCISLSDLNRGYYDKLNLTLALHPSETERRLVARVLAFLLNAQRGLCFTKGLSSVNEPDLWLRELNGVISQWIEVGEPDYDRLKKASIKSEWVKLYSFNKKSDVWWQQNQVAFAKLKNLSIYRFEVTAIEAFVKLLVRTMEYSVTISERSIYIATLDGEVELNYQLLSQN
ncbi:MAG: YaeQ family protein [Acidiferrobacterales bacterium]|nr:YaeQ family protein [Acidiferrobacterales bacterium]